MTHIRHDLLLVLAAALLLLVIASPARAVEPEGDKNLGYAYAKAHCAECHSIEAGAKSSLVINATPFATIAKSTRLTIKGINGWLISSHKSMRNPAIPVENRADLVAYIKSLALK